MRRYFVWNLRTGLPGSDAVVRTFSIELEISEERYESFRNLPRESDRERWSGYAEISFPEIDHLAARLSALNREHGLGWFDQVANVLSFAQDCLTYQPDREKHVEHDEYVQYPIETLVEGTGDCEDHAILAAALLARLGFKTGLILMPGHCGIGVAIPDEFLDGFVHHHPWAELGYLYGEATRDGCRFGQLPPEYVDLKKHLLPVRPLALELELEDGQCK